MNIKIITDERDFLYLRDRWEKLFWENGIYPFTSWIWNYTWWKYYGKGKKLFIITFWEDDELVAIIPLMKVFGEMGLPFWRLKFIASDCSDYLDILYNPKYEELIINNFLNCIDLCLGSLIIADFEHIPDGSFMLKLSKLIKNLNIEVMEQDICPYLELPGSWEELKKNLNKRFRKNIEYAERRLSREFNVIYREVRKETDILNSLDKLMILHQQRMNRRFMPGAFFSYKKRLFHKDLVDYMAQEDMVRIYDLVIEQKCVGSLYAFIKGKSLYYYLSGFDVNYKKYSPGMVLLSYVIKTSISEGFEVFDFLRGEEEYKFLWTDRYRINYRILIGKTNVISHLLSKLIRTENIIEKKIKKAFI